MPGTSASRFEFDHGDLRSAVDHLQFHGRGRADARGGMARFFQIRRQRHGEAARFRGADQFLGIGAARVFETGAEGIRAFVSAAAELHCAFALLQGAFPNC